MKFTTSQPTRAEDFLQNAKKRSAVTMIERSAAWRNEDAIILFYILIKRGGDPLTEYNRILTVTVGWINFHFVDGELVMVSFDRMAPRWRFVFDCRWPLNPTQRFLLNQLDHGST